MSAMVVRERLMEVAAGEGGEPAARRPVGEEKSFRPYDPDQVLLMAPVLSGGVPYRDVAVRMLCADQPPDYRSIARFRARHLEALGELFVQALRLCSQARLVGLGALALDGTKLPADAPA